MDKNAVIEKIKELIAAPSCYEGLKNKAQAYLDSVGKDNEKEVAKAMITELEADVNTIDETIDFLVSDKAKNMFGAEKVAEMLEGAKAFKSKGEKYCFCPACQAGIAIINAKHTLLN